MRIRTPHTKAFRHRTQRHRRIRSMWLAPLALGLVALDAHAHKLNMFAYVEGNKVFVEGYFADGKKARNSDVKVFGPSRDILLEGTTNDQGEFSFVSPAQSDLRILINAGMGHVTEYTVAATELTGVAKTGAKPRVTNDPKGSEASADAAMNTAALEQLVQTSVAEAMKPLAREISELKSKTSLSDIIGGVGYIFGFIGLFAYLKTRKEQ